MDLTPAPVGYTVLTKSSCGDCEKVKALLRDKQLEFTSVQCDDYLSGGARARFLDHIHALVKNTNPIRFPLVFHNGVYIGGLQATRNHVEDEDW